MIERFARTIDPGLPARKVDHCRQATIAWCVFFGLNGTACLALALLAPLSLWALYTGGIAYALIGAMMAGEYGVRRVRFG